MTVLQQGDLAGVTGATGATGATGDTGAAGAFTNVLSIELVYTFSPTATATAVALATTYVVEAGASGFWKASGDHSYVNASFTANPGITTISNFLETSSDKFSVHLKLIKTKILNSSGVSVLLPDNVTSGITAEIYNISNDNIVIRIIRVPLTPTTFQVAAFNYRVRELTFSLLIIGTDQ